MTTPQQTYLGEILTRRGVIPRERLAGVFESMRDRGQGITDVLVQSNIADEGSIARALADECGLPFLSKIDESMVVADVASKLPIGYAKLHKILAIRETCLLYTSPSPRDS